MKNLEEINIESVNKNIEKLTKQLHELADIRKEYYKMRYDKLETKYLKIDYRFYNTVKIFYIKKLEFHKWGEISRMTGDCMVVEGDKPGFTSDMILYVDDIKRNAYQYISKEEYDELFEKGLNMIKDRNNNKQ